MTPPPSHMLEDQLASACAALREWTGTIDLPTNPLLALQRDAENRSLLRAYPELSLLIAGRVRDGHLGIPLVRDACRREWSGDGRRLLGLHPRRWPPTSTEAIVVRTLVADFVRAGVSRCA